MLISDPDLDETNSNINKTLSFLLNDLKTEEDISKKIPLPCLEACLILNEKNIQLLASGIDLAANKAYIAACYLTLSPINREIVNNMADLGLVSFDSDECKTIFNLEVSNVKNKTEKVISTIFVNLAQFFDDQDVLYGRLNKEQLEADYLSYTQKLGFSDDSLTVPETVKKDYLKHKIYDEISGDYFVSETLFNKHKKFISNHIKRR